MISDGDARCILYFVFCILCFFKSWSRGFVASIKQKYVSVLEVLLG